MFIPEPVPAGACPLEPSGEGQYLNEMEALLGRKEPGTRDWEGDRQGPGGLQTTRQETLSHVILHSRGCW